IASSASWKSPGRISQFSPMDPFITSRTASQSSSRAKDCSFASSIRTSLATCTACRHEERASAKGSPSMSGGKSCQSLPFIRKTIDRFHALAQGFEQSWAPAERDKGRRLLIDLLVGLSKEAHGELVAACIFVHRNAELHGLIALISLEGEPVQLCEFIRGLRFDELPFCHSF